MDDDRFKLILENEREWRAYVIDKIDKIESKLSEHMSYNLVFRIIGSSLFALILIWMEYKLNQK